MVDLLMYWSIAWVVYEVIAVLLMSEWYFPFWLVYLPYRFVLWPYLAITMVSQLYSYNKRYGRLNLWWRSN